MEKTLEKTEVNLCPTEIVILVLGLTFIKHPIEKISRSAVYRGFKKLSEHYPAYFEGFFFSEKGGKGQWHSLRLEDILFNLGGLFWEPAPEFRYLHPASGTLDMISETLKKLCPNEKEKHRIYQMVYEFFKEISST